MLHLDHAFAGCAALWLCCPVVMRISRPAPRLPTRPPPCPQVESWIHDHPKIPLTCHNPFPARIAFRALYAVVGATCISTGLQLQRDVLDGSCEKNETATSSCTGQHPASHAVADAPVPSLPSLPPTLATSDAAACFISECSSSGRALSCCVACMLCAVGGMVRGSSSSCTCHASPG